MTDTITYIRNQVFSYPYLDDFYCFRYFNKLDTILLKIHKILSNKNFISDRYLDLIYEVTTCSRNSPLYHYCKPIKNASDLRDEDMGFLIEGANYIHSFLNKEKFDIRKLNINRGVLFELFQDINNLCKDYTQASVQLSLLLPSLCKNSVNDINTCQDKMQELQQMLKGSDGSIFSTHLQLEYYFRLYHKTFSKIYESYLRVVYKEAKRIVRTNYDAFPQAFQNGSMGLIKAIEYFDVSKMFVFRTYASSRIRKAILEESEKEVNIIPISNSIWRKYRKFEKIKNKYHAEGDVVSHIAEVAKVDTSIVEEVYNDIEMKRTDSLDAPLTSSDGSKESTLLDKISQNTFEVEQEENTIDTNILGAGIKQKIMKLLFGFVNTEESKIDKNIIRDEIVRQILN